MINVQLLISAIKDIIGITSSVSSILPSNVETQKSCVRIVV